MAAPDRAEATRLLIASIHARLAEVRDAEPSQLVVVGVWNPWEGLCVVSLAGEIDIGNAAEVAAALSGQLAVGPTRLVIELSAVDFIDSTGINEVVKLSRALKVSGGTIALAAPPASLARVFEIVRIGDGIAVVNSLEEALAGGGSPTLRDG